MPPVRRKPNNKAQESPLQFWAIVLFESLGFGVLAITLAVAAVLVLVGIYVQIIWPLTDWALYNVSLDAYRDIITFTAIIIFFGASGAGFWLVSGQAWQKPRTRTAHAVTARRRS